MPFLGLGPWGLGSRAAHAQNAGESRKSLQPIARSGARGQPVKLGIKLPKTGGPRFARVLGVPKDFRLSHGFSLGAGATWYVAASDLPTLELIPPEGFTGASQLYVDFFTQSAASDKPVYTRSEWYVVKMGMEGNPAADSSTAAISDAAPTPPQQRPGQPYEEEAVAILRAQDLIAHGDITAARLLYEDLAINGSGAGAFALARTYDPDFLRSIGVIGMQPDLELARKWYEKAKALGNVEASQRLSRLR
jgi:TPR repeat protein